MIGDRATLATPVAFGAAAHRLLERIPGEFNVVATEPDGAVFALAAAARRRRAGIPFFAAPLVDDPRGRFAQSMSAGLLAQYRDVDGRRDAFTALAAQTTPTFDGTPQTEGAVLAEPQRRALRDLTILGDVLLTRSAREAERVRSLIGYRPRYGVVVPGRDPAVPTVRPSGGEGFVVWGPELDAARLGVLVMALDHFRVPVVVVCAAGELPEVRARFVRPEQGAEALVGASAVLAASLSDPGTTIALAESGLPVAAASTAGASEFLDGVFEYDPWDWRSIHTMASRMRGAGAPVLRQALDASSDVRAAGERACPTLPADGPLVSVVLATYNRRDLLPSSLDSLAAQHYRNLDVIVVNDGGDDVADICGRYGFVRLMTLERNVGMPVAMEIGTSWVRGKYFAYWSDDDPYFPDHYARLVHALETTGAAVGHTMTLTRYYDVVDGQARTRAYKVLHDRPLDQLEMYVGPTMTFGAMLFRSDLIETIGMPDASLAINDVEYQLRASLQHDFVAVDAVTLQWNYRVDRKSYQHEAGRERMLGDTRRVYDRYPSTSTIIRERRKRWYDYYEKNFDSVLWKPDSWLPEDYSD